MLKSKWMGLGLALSLVGACSQQDNTISEEQLAEQWQSQKVDNGMELNGMRVNGLRVNGLRVNGLRVNGTTVEGTLGDTELTVSGADLNNSDIDSENEGGDVVPLKIASVFYSPAAGKNLYNVKHYNEDTATWEWVCGTDSYDNPIAAMPMRKSWNLLSGVNVDDPDRWTMSCVNAALGKCAMWGYQPYTQNYSETLSGETRARDLALSHQTCQRLVRADYCGDGIGHTKNGTPIDVYDTYGVMTPDNLAENSLEADWRADGAHCIRHTRWVTADPALTGGLTDLAYIQANCPSRLAANDPSCNNDSLSSFHQVNGFSLTDQTQRNLLRAQSFQHN